MILYYTNLKLDLELREISTQKQAIGRELKKLVLEKKNIIDIGRWAFSIYSEYCRELESGLSQLMLDLNAIEVGDEFAISYEMLNKIANDLIAGKDIDLNAKEYRNDNQ